MKKTRPVFPFTGRVLLMNSIKEENNGENREQIEKQINIKQLT